MLFSVVIPTFNRLKYLPATLACVRAQRFTDFETVVVDDGSTDGTHEFLASIPGIRVVHQSNAGPGPARNAGVAVAKGDYIAFLDSDDVWFPWTLEAFAAVITASSPSIVTASVIEFFDEGRLAQVSEMPARHRAFTDFFSSSATPISVGSGTAVIRRATFLASGGFTDRSINAEDHDLILRLGDAAGFVQMLAPVTLAWRRHGHSETGDLTKSVDGMVHLIVEEQAGHYPGGPPRAKERRQIITRHLRPVSFAALRLGQIGVAARLYRMAFLWHLQSARLSYLAAFPFAMAWRALKGPAQS